MKKKSSDFLIEEVGVPLVSTRKYRVVNASEKNEILDCGVLYASSGRPLVRVQSHPRKGQYCHTDGIYKLSLADCEKRLTFTYHVFKK